MQKAEVVSVKTFVERFNERSREKGIAWFMEHKHVPRVEAEKMQDAMLKDIVESAIAAGDVDPILP